MTTGVAVALALVLGEGEAPGAGVVAAGVSEGSGEPVGATVAETAVSEATGVLEGTTAVSEAAGVTELGRTDATVVALPSTAVVPVVAVMAGVVVSVAAGSGRLPLRAKAARA